MMLSTTNTSLSWGIRRSFQFLTVFLIALVISVLYLTQNPGGSGLISASTPPKNPTSTSQVTDGCRGRESGADHDERSNTGSSKEEQVQKVVNIRSPNPSPNLGLNLNPNLSLGSNPSLSPSPSLNPKCDVFSGRWVFDNQTYPLYREKECPYMWEQQACEKYGRKDLNYQSWRWQPHHCDLPRFNGTTLLERLRNKRLMFVGDFLNRGQWVSMICLVQGSVPHPLKSVQFNGSLSIFKAEEYNATIEFYWAPLLIESNADEPGRHRVPETIARAQAIEKHARFWTYADILVFDTHVWWRKPTIKIQWGSFGNPEAIIKEIDNVKGYEMAMRTWSDWIDIHVNHYKTQIFWMSMSPTHEGFDKMRSEGWGRAEGINCYKETQPIIKQDYHASSYDMNMMKIIESEIERLSKIGVNIKLLNITELSFYRKEGHPSIYKQHFEPPTQYQLANPSSYSDCVHWCLPGVPDTWNEILYAYILNYV